MNCLYYYIESGQQIAETIELNKMSQEELETLGIKRIGTDIELDGYLYDHRADFLQEIDKVDYTYYLPVDATPTQVLSEINKMHSDGRKLQGDDSKRYNVTTLWQSTDIATFKTHESEDSKRRKEIEASLKNDPEYVSATDAMKYQIIDRIRKKDFETIEIAMGTELGNIVQQLLENENYQIVENRKEINNSEFWDSVKTEIPKIVKSLKSKFPEGTTFYFEQNVSTENITEELKGILRTLSGRDTVTHLLGRVDITAILPDGKVATIEMKTSPYTLPSSVYDTTSSFPQSTLKQYASQVLTYDAIRKQRGIRSTPYLFNITIDPTTRKIINNRLQLIEIPTDHNIGWFSSLVQRAIPLDQEVKIESVDSSNSLLSVIFGSGSSVGTKLETIKRDVNFFLDPKNEFLRYVDPKKYPKAYADGYRYYFIDSGDRFNKIEVFAKTQDEFKEKTIEYLQKLDKKSQAIWKNLGKKFNQCKNYEDVKTLLLDLGYPRNKSAHLLRLLWKYTKPGWKLVDDEVLISNGMLLFQSSVGSEIVMLEEVKSLFTYNEFKKRESRTTILGNKYSDAQSQSAYRDILSAQQGHLLLIKAMSIVSKHPKFFTNGKILNISAINARRGEIIDTVSNETLINNWKYLKVAFPKEDLPIVDHIFADDVNACVLRARDMLHLCENSTIEGHDGIRVEVKDISNWEILKMDPEGIRYSYEQLVKMRNSLQTIFDGYRQDKMDSRLRKAFDEINKAILIVSGYRFATERDNPEYGGKGIAFTGGYTSPNYRSPSMILQTMGEISNAMHYKMNEIVQQLFSPFQVKLVKALNANSKYSSALGGEYMMSDEWFVKDENGQIDSSFRFKSLSDPYFIGRDAERELLEYVLDTFARLRNPKQIDLEEDKSNPLSEYYKCPLYESGFRESIVTSDNKISDLFTLTKKKAQRLVNVGLGLVNGLELEQGVKSEDLDELLHKSSTENPFFDPNREDKLQKYGPNAFTKNIDSIFLYTVITGVKHSVSQELLPQIHAILDLIRAVNNDNNAGMREIENTLKQYVKTVIFDKSGVKTSLLWAEKILQTFRQLYAVSTLGLNPKNMTRDIFSNNLRTAITMLNGKDPATLGISADDYFEAYEEMCLDMGSLFTSNGYHNQLNLIHRVANMSYREIADQIKTNKFAVGNIDSNFLFITSTSSDYLHRMALLKAYLKKLKANNAYVMKDGVVTYDMSKDERWTMLFKYKVGAKFNASDYGTIQSKEDKELWQQQWVEYTESIRAWQKSKPSLVTGDELPLALSPDQERSLISLSNNMYGAYTKDEQALVHRTLLGGAFFQFKTYGISRMIDYYRAPGQIAIILNDYLRDESGNIIYEIINDPETVEKTGEYSRYVTEDKVTTEERISGRARPVRVQKGAIDEGKCQSYYAAMVALISKEEEMEWRLKDPMTRMNLLRALIDTFTSLMIMGLIEIIYPEEKLTNMNDQDWWTRWSHAVATGIAQDGPIWEVFNSIWGGGEIPVVRGVSRWVTSAMGVIHGNDFLPALVSSIGATRELSAMLDNDF